MGTATLFDPEEQPRTLLTLPSYVLQTPLTAASAAWKLSIIKFYDKSLNV